VPTFDLTDRTYVVARPAQVRETFADAAAWGHWWPGWLLTVTEDRGPLGVRWWVSRPVVGSLEIWLEEHPEGTVVHMFLRAEPLAPTDRIARRPARFASDVTRQWKLRAWALKDRLEAGRPPGQPPAMR